MPNDCTVKCFRTLDEVIFTNTAPYHPVKYIFLTAYGGYSITILQSSVYEIPRLVVEYQYG